MTTQSIEVALSERYAAPDYAFLLQVRNGTGFQRTVRTADALAFSLYPSRGLTITGFEIKVSKGDWKRELTNPAKAEDIARFCHTWFVVAPKGVVPVDEVPHNWGLMELRDNGKFISTKGALPQEAEPLTPLMLASIMRNISNGMIPRSSIQHQIDKATESINAKSEQTIEFRTRNDERLRESVEAFEQASGVRIQAYQGGDIGDAVRTLMRYKAGPDDFLRQLQYIRNSLNHLDAELEATIQQVGRMVNEDQQSVLPLAAAYPRSDADMGA